MNVETDYFYCSVSLVNECHFVKEVGCLTNLLDGEEHISDVKADVAAEVHVEVDVAHCAFPYPVEVYSDQVAVSIQDRAA